MSYSQTEKRERLAAFLQADRESLRKLIEEGFHEPPIVLTANTVLTALDHGGKMLVVNKADGAALTLPAASGSGVKFKVMIGTTISSNTTTIKVANANDTMVGAIHTATATAGAGLHEAAAGTDDTITMNGTTLGGIVGSYVEIEDVAENVWRVKGELVGSGTLATSLSATVT